MMTKTEKANHRHNITQFVLNHPRVKIDPPEMAEPLAAALKQKHNGTFIH